MLYGEMTVWLGGTSGSSSARLPFSDQLRFDSGELTIAFWINPSDANQDHTAEVLIDNFTVGPGGFKITENWGSYIFTFQDRDGNQRNFSLGIGHSGDIADRWSHVAVSYSNDDDRFRVYFNGKLHKTSEEFPDLNFHHSLNGSSRGIRIGQRAVANYAGFHGMLDELYLYTRSLGESEIQSLYYLGMVESQEILTPQAIVDITGSAIGNNIEVHISTDQGQSWFDLSSTRGLRELGALLPNNSFRYRIFFLNLTSTVSEINLTLDTSQLTACNDGLDNDGDGRTDLVDPGCSSSSDNNETSGTCETEFKLHDRIGKGSLDFSSVPLTSNENQLYGCNHFSNPVEAFDNLTDYDNYVINTTNTGGTLRENFGEYIETRIGNLPSDYSDIIIFDCEAFGGNWKHRMFSAHDTAKAQVIAIVAAETGLTGQALTNAAIIRFNEAVEGFFRALHAKVKSIRPLSKFGLYNYPSRSYSESAGGEMSQSHKNLNDNELLYLYKLLDVLSPSIYSLYPSRDVCNPDYGSTISEARNIEYYQAHTLEARRLADREIARFSFPHTSGIDIIVILHSIHSPQDLSLSVSEISITR